MITWTAVAPNPPSFGARTWLAMALVAAIVVVGLVITLIAAHHRRK